MPILVQLIIGLAIVGVLVYLFNALIPMDARFKTVINALIGLALFIFVLYCLSGLFGWGWFGGADMPHVRRGC